MPEESHLSWFIIPAVVAAAVFLFAVFLEFFARKNPAIKKLAEVLRTGSFLSPTIISLVVGVLFIIAGWHNYLFAPGLGLDGSLLSQILRYAQIIIGLGLILGILTRYLTFGIIALFAAGFFIFPTVEMFDYLIFLGVGVFLFLIHDDMLSSTFIFHPLGKKEFFDKYRKFAQPILRIFAGIGLAFAAFHHNILDSANAVAFLEAKPLLNFMQNVFGFEDFTNAHLIFNVGIFGMLLGLIMALGLLARFFSSLIGIGLLLMVFLMGWSFVPIAVPYFAIIYSIITGNQFEERELIEKA